MKVEYTLQYGGSPISRRLQMAIEAAFSGEKVLLYSRTFDHSRRKFQEVLSLLEALPKGLITHRMRNRIAFTNGGEIMFSEVGNINLQGRRFDVTIDELPQVGRKQP